MHIDIFFSKTVKFRGYLGDEEFANSGMVVPANESNANNSGYRLQKCKDGYLEYIQQPFKLNVSVDRVFNVAAVSRPPSFLFFRLFDPFLSAV